MRERELEAALSQINNSQQVYNFIDWKTGRLIDGTMGYLIKRTDMSLIGHVNMSQTGHVIASIFHR